MFEIFPDVLFRLAQKVLRKKMSEDRTWNPKSFNSYFVLVGMCIYIYIYIKYQYIYIYIYICTVCPTLLGCYALSTCDSIPAGKKSKQKKSKVHLPTFIPLHYTNNNLGIHRPACRFLHRFSCFEKKIQPFPIVKLLLGKKTCLLQKLAFALCWRRPEAWFFPGYYTGSPPRLPAYLFEDPAQRALVVSRG